MSPRQRAAVWAGTFAVAFLLSLEPAAAQPGVPAEAPYEYAVDRGDGTDQVVVIERDGQVAWWGPVRRIRSVAAPAVVTADAPLLPWGVPGLIREAARRYGLDPDRMLRIAWCESKFDPRAYNRASGAAGVFQFVPGTWAAWGRGSPFDPAANVEAAMRLMRAEGPRHWVCK